MFGYCSAFLSLIGMTAEYDSDDSSEDIEDDNEIFLKESGNRFCQSSVCNF